jgi:hypothetical protein
MENFQIIPKRRIERLKKEEIRKYWSSAGEKAQKRLEMIRKRAVRSQRKLSLTQLRELERECDEDIALVRDFIENRPFATGDPEDIRIYTAFLTYFREILYEDLADSIRFGAGVYYQIMLRRWLDYVSGLMQVYSSRVKIGEFIESVITIPKPPPPIVKKATIDIDTIPVKGIIYLNGKFLGRAPQSVKVDAGTYTISFGDIPDYIKPSDIIITVKEGERKTVIGEYRRA